LEQVYTTLATSGIVFVEQRYWKRSHVFGGLPNENPWVRVSHNWLVEMKTDLIKRWKKVCWIGDFYSLNEDFPTTIAHSILNKISRKQHRFIGDDFPFKFHSSEFSYLESCGLAKSFTAKWIINLCGAPHKKSIIHHQKPFDS
jgi:hypothetical protein